MRRRLAAPPCRREHALAESDRELFLDTLARDNEEEFVRVLLEKHLAKGFVLAEAALASPDRDARWQIAAFLGTQKHETVALIPGRQASHTPVR